MIAEQRSLAALKVAPPVPMVGEVASVVAFLKNQISHYSIHLQIIKNFQPN